MKLEDYYYKVYSMHTDGADTLTLHIAFLPDCDIFRGHFPGQPVCPGACSIQLAKEAAMRLTGRRLRISAIRQCRFTALATPDRCPEVDVRVDITGRTESGYSMTARIGDAQQSYMELKAELEVVHSDTSAACLPKQEELNASR